LKIYNKKKNILKYFFFKKYNVILKYFIKLIDYICNFFFTLEDFFINFFFYYGYKKKYILGLYNNELDFSFYLKNIFKNKFLNIFFSRTVNNYYFDNFFLKNSKVMSLAALKTYIKF
jgi:hypothetical protein